MASPRIDQMECLQLLPMLLQVLHQVKQVKHQVEHQSSRKNLFMVLLRETMAFQLLTLCLHIKVETLVKHRPQMLFQEQKLLWMERNGYPVEEMRLSETILSSRVARMRGNDSL